jgi:hypothetical protein
MTVLGGLVLASSAQAATLAVDDNGADCPAAPYTSIQAAVDAAAPGDTIAVCAGNYAEGTGAVGTNALTITKNLTIKGAGADLVKITPVASSPAGGQIMESGTPDIRNGIGDIVAVVGAPTKPINVDISGVTVDGLTPDGKPVAVEAGVLYLDAKGSIRRSRVTDTVTSEGDLAFSQPGGYRGSQPGVGIVQTSATKVLPVDGTRTLDIELTRVDKYNKYGILIDGAQNDTLPLVPSGAINRALIDGTQVVGRTQCINYQGTGDCSVVGPVLTGPLFGQDGIRVTAGARAQIADSLVSQNLVNGLGAPTRGNGTTTGNNPGNLILGAGIRLIGAKMTTNPVSNGLGRSFNTSVTRSSIVDNAYGALNYAIDGVTPNTGTTTDGTASGPGSNVFKAENNWWGVRINSTVNTGPLISPAINPPWPENPVGGASRLDPDVPAQTISDSVDFFPFRNGLQSDGQNGQFAAQTVPLPVDDYAPTVSVTASAASVERGQPVTLTAEASDDFGVKRVRFYDGATVVGSVAKPAYTQAVTIPGDAACGSTRTFTATATDSIDQTASGSAATVTVSCPASGPGPGPGPVTAPSIAFASMPTTLSAATTVLFNVKSDAGVKLVQVRLGDRIICTLTAAPYACKVTPTGADVGTQSLTAAVVDNAGNTTAVTTKVTVPKFKPKRLGLSIKTTPVKGGKAKRTIRGTLSMPAGVTKAQGCKSGKVTVTIKRSGQSVLNQQVSVSKLCTFSRSVTASRSKQHFSVSARFGGNAVLTTTTTSRRFS